MDLVYQNADTCIGLLDTRWEQQHLDIFLGEHETEIGQHEHRRRGAPPSLERYSRSRTGFTKDLIEAVSRLLDDRWNTRAWIFQEACVSADKMLLLFPRNELENTDGWFLVCNEKSMTEIAINLDMMQKTFEAAFFPLLGAQRALRGPGEGASTDNSLKVEELLESARYFYPRPMDSPGRVGVGSFGTRRRCDAATALSYLKRRHLLRVADRIAILANLCKYEHRFNTVELEKSQQSLSLCILALSITNGDFSLLAFEMYKTPQDHPIGQLTRDAMMFLQDRNLKPFS